MYLYKEGETGYEKRLGLWIGGGFWGEKKSRRVAFHVRGAKPSTSGEQCITHLSVGPPRARTLTEITEHTTKHGGARALLFSSSIFLPFLFLSFFFFFPLFICDDDILVVLLFFCIWSNPVFLFTGIFRSFTKAIVATQNNMLPEFWN